MRPAAPHSIEGILSLNHGGGLLSAPTGVTLIMGVLSRLARDGRLLWPASQEPAGGYVRLCRQSQGHRACAWPIQCQADRRFAWRRKTLPVARLVNAGRPTRTPYPRDGRSRLCDLG